jgi:hypothetical protein
MKLKLFFSCLFMVLILRKTDCQEQFETKNTQFSVDFISALKDTLSLLSEKSDNEFFKMHCNSMISVIKSKSSYTKQDSSFINDTYNAFNNNADTANAKELSTYLKRQRNFILSWVSRTDGAVSFSWLKPPKNWDPGKEYPLYIQLHGDWDVASNSIRYMTYPFLNGAATDSSFNDGYLLEPWGRGNLWYEGISQTDIWECIASLEEIVKIDPARKYISGHSMGGYGAFLMAIKSPNMWAALGLHAGAIGYKNFYLLTSGTAEILKNLPTYFVVGTDDPMMFGNSNFYQLLIDAGNPNAEFVTFAGGHIYLEDNVENMYLWMRNFVNEDWNTDIKNTEVISQLEFRIKCYPNPVSTSAHILYTISENSKVSLSVYDTYGRIVSELMNEIKNPGEYEVTFDASELTNGIYLVRMKTGDVVTDSKMVVVR